MATTLINPSDLVKPLGYSHGAMGTGRLAGQIGSDKEGKLVGDGLVEQFDRALGSVVRVVEEAGGKAEHIVKLNLLVLDKNEYREKGRDMGAVYRKHMGRHFPAMTLAEVKGLWDEGAKVEVEAVAMLP
ncbi:MAG: hypothetical protein AMK69_26740 [Nitrospira bacterium SG8_3]|nr:MAG: hypothetical protein AMK69_26740 [Nitrospira bacterium SG8_3]